MINSGVEGSRFEQDMLVSIKRLMANGIVSCYTDYCEGDLAYVRADFLVQYAPACLDRIDPASPAYIGRSPSIEKQADLSMISDKLRDGIWIDSKYSGPLNLSAYPIAEIGLKDTESSYVGLVDEECAHRMLALGGLFSFFLFRNSVGEHFAFSGLDFHLLAPPISNPYNRELDRKPPRAKEIKGKWMFDLRWGVKCASIDEFLAKVPRAVFCIMRDNRILKTFKPIVGQESIYTSRILGNPRTAQYWDTDLNGRE